MLGSSHFKRDSDELDSMNDRSNGINSGNQCPKSATSNNNSNEYEIRSFDGIDNLTSSESYFRKLNYLTGELNFRISQEMNSIINFMNSQTEWAINSTISERSIPQM